MKKPYTDLLALDICLGGAVSPEVLKCIPAVTRQHNLLCWDIAAPDLRRIKNKSALGQFRTLARQHDWNISEENLKRTQFDALVITDRHQRIEWVSRGFRGMTGYGLSEVRHRKPSFLQGEATDQHTLNMLRDAIGRHQPVQAVIMNYRKDRSAYRCHVDIMPLFNRQALLTHFVAFETAID